MSIDNSKGVPQSISDRAAILERPAVVPRESKLLARKTIADVAANASECRELLDMLGLLDLDTLQEPA